MMVRTARHAVSSWRPAPLAFQDEPNGSAAVAGYNRALFCFTTSKE